MPENTTNVPGAPATDNKTGFFHRHLTDEITLLILLGCSFAGIAITNISPARSQLFWLAMVPVFFVASLVTEMPHIRAGKYPWKIVLWNHTLHWLALLFSVQMIFIINQTGRLNNETTGLMLLLVFALSTFVAGIRMGWLFRLAGLFLAGGLLLVVYLERYMWVLVLIAIIILLIHHYLVRPKSHPHRPVDDHGEGKAHGQTGRDQINLQDNLKKPNGNQGE